VDLTTRTLTLGSMQTLSPRASNDLRFNYSHNRGTNRANLDEFGGALRPPDSIVFPDFASSQNAQLFFQISGGTGAAFQLGSSIDNVQRQINVVDNLSLVAGSHQLKFGVDYRRLTPVIAPRTYFQQALFSSLANALAGRTSSVTIQSSADPRTALLTNVSFYGQDTWRVTPRLTITYGLRYEVNPAPSELHGNDPFAVTGVDNFASLALALRGEPLYETTYNNVAPRLGAAYQLSQRQGWETVLRGGYGVFYDMGNAQALQAFAQYPT
jgi:outer membrane receptor protein involved in Fe transport